MSKQPKSAQLQKPAATVDSPKKHSAASNGAWYSRPLTLSLSSGLLLWACFPPLGIWPLAWVAAGPLIALMLPNVVKLRRRDYFKIWFGGFVHWMLLVYFVTLPHWAGYFGWVAMSGYLAVFFPMFVWFGRCLTRHLRFPILLAAPIAWVAVELLRSHLLTGFGMAMLPHAMFKIPVMIQLADIAGGYGISFLMVLVTASCVEMLGKWSKKNETPLPRFFFWTRPGVCVFVLALMVAYGYWKLNSNTAIDGAEKSSVNIVLIQGSIDTIFPKTLEESRQFYERQLTQYRNLTIEARRKHPDVDLLVWPESMFPSVYFESKGESQPSAEAQKILGDSKRRVRSWFYAVQGAAALPDEDPNQIEFKTTVPLLTGANILNASNDQSYNGAMLFNKNGIVLESYYKNHRVPFGEYFPLGHLIPWVYDLMPIGQPLTPGQQPVVFEVQGVKIAANICFESTVTHLINRHLRELKRRDQEPDLLANLTNDGWFFGSNCLDLHLACNVFRSVEFRKPSIVAANTGFSGYINARGELLQVGPRRDTGVLLVEFQKEKNGVSIYRTLGDYPPIVCLCCCIIAVLIGIRVTMARRMIDRAQNK